MVALDLEVGAAGSDSVIVGKVFERVCCAPPVLTTTPGGADVVVAPVEVDTVLDTDSVPEVAGSVDGDDAGCGESDGDDDSVALDDVSSDGVASVVDEDSSDDGDPGGHGGYRQFLPIGCPTASIIAAVAR